MINLRSLHFAASLLLLLLLAIIVRAYLLVFEHYFRRHFAAHSGAPQCDEPFDSNRLSSQLTNYMLVAAASLSQLD